MAKSTKDTVKICTVLSIIALVGIIIGFITNFPLITIILLIPTVIYEIYRTEGFSTKAASLGLLVVLIALLVSIAAKINFDLAAIFGLKDIIIRGQRVPLGDIKIIGPVIMTLLSVMLFVRTNGIYTRWLAVIIIITSGAIIFLIDPSLFSKFLSSTSSVVK